MTNMSLQRFGTIGAVLAVSTLAGCANWWGHSSSQHAGAAPVRQTAAVQPPVSQGLVRQVQSRLRSDGYYKTGNIDGLWGIETQDAVERYQQAHNLKPTGQIDASTLQAMNIATDNSNSGPQASPPNNTSNDYNNGNYNNGTPNQPQPGTPHNPNG